MSNKMRPYKFSILPIIQIVNDDGDVVAEEIPPQFRTPQGNPAPSMVFGCKNLEEWAQQFSVFLEELQNQMDMREHAELLASRQSSENDLSEIVLPIDPDETRSLPNEEGVVNEPVDSEENVNDGNTKT